MDKICEHLLTVRIFAMTMSHIMFLTQKKKHDNNVFFGSAFAKMFIFLHKISIVQSLCYNTKKKETLADFKCIWMVINGFDILVAFVSISHFGHRKDMKTSGQTNVFWIFFLVKKRRHVKLSLLALSVQSFFFPSSKLLIVNPKKK